jgi:hypothetical protein
MITHKSHARWRQTVCKIKYNNIIDLHDFVRNKLKGHWRLVNCKNCHNNRKNYEKSLRKWVKLDNIKT